ncbi:hypothetical protein KC343_g15940 [Hortaea werneckii]|uniref:Ubiquitin-conjugating enzyme E2C-binding protein n=1 Tax=Hortaea werneckii TaxID=91943 RepID=A0A3M7CKW5_HORWE|nr:hypothetical protein KC352_g30442 [Hortaea werneckii]KAI7544451.1 hypothetical protein KC317_g16011 [Hortaea werneckii]KAI7593347.1 hypothetical protein KC346_g15869 [Hortaea werneckii]KAI7599695.1 hypothetical protein KC343_g15940 [Hortaea werneckii]KAI7634395.1 hypothetical protein KC319_g15709 [Hortaea werneckii]
MDDSCGHASSSAAAAHHPRIHLYAEHLQNIRTLSIQASLATFSNTETKATLSADGSQLSLSHEGETATIQLPITVPGGHNDATLVIPSAPSKELTFRVSLEEKPGSNLLGERPAGGETIVPWMSSHLSASAEISCASCRSVLIPRGTVTQWKDLPSEGWAEMMDFWHCHKPDVPHDHHHHDVHGANGSAGRGIGANSRLAVERGVGLVGPLELLFAKEDTRGIKVSSTHLTSSHENTLLCINCNTNLGNFDANTQAHRLEKQSLSICDNPDSASISHDMELWLSCHLLTSADAQGVRKFKVYRHSTQEFQSPTIIALQIWLFATDLVISSSASKVPKPLPVLKILYKEVEVPAEEITGRLNAHALSEGELELPQHEWELLSRLLEKSAGLLPSRARGFQDWKVGVLRRFTRDGVMRSTGSEE